MLLSHGSSWASGRPLPALPVALAHSRHNPEAIEDFNHVLFLGLIFHIAMTGVRIATRIRAARFFGIGTENFKIIVDGLGGVVNDLTSEVSLLTDGLVSAKFAISAPVPLLH